MIRTIDELMFINDGHIPFSYLFVGKGGLGFEPTEYNIKGSGYLDNIHHEILKLENIPNKTKSQKERLSELFRIKYGTIKRMKGGMANYNRKGEIVEQTEKEGEIKNYLLTTDNISENIINNDNLDQKEKNNQLLTTYYELISLDKIARTEQDKNEIENLKEFIKTELDKNVYEEKINPDLEKTIIKKVEGFEKGKPQPIYKEVDDIDYQEIVYEFKNAFDNKDLTKLSILMDDYGFKKKDLEGIIFKPNKTNFEFLDKIDYNDLINKIVSRHDIIRGNKSEELMIPWEEGKEKKDILMDIFTGDFGEVYNSKDDKAYHKDFFKNVFQEIENQIGETLSQDDKNKIKKQIKHSFPIDVIGQDNLYELKSRDKDIYNKKNSASYTKTKLLTTHFYLPESIKGNKLDFFINYDYNTDGTQLKNIKTKIRINNNDEKTTKEILTLKTNKNGYNLNWVDIDKNGTIFLDPLSKDYGVITSNTLNDRKKLVLYNIIEYIDDYNKIADDKNKIKKNKNKDAFSINDILMKSGNNPTLDKYKTRNKLKEKYKIDDETIDEIFDLIDIGVDLKFEPKIKSEFLDKNKYNEDADDKILFKFNKGIKQNPIQNILYNKNKKDWVRRNYTKKK